MVAERSSRRGGRERSDRWKGKSEAVPPPRSCVVGSPFAVPPLFQPMNGLSSQNVLNFQHELKKFPVCFKGGKEQGSSFVSPRIFPSVVGVDFRWESLCRAQSLNGSYSVGHGLRTG
ncbi:MAG: hypothetical protein ACOC5F_04845 [Candidatus Aminicenantaceae bacterium]